MCQRAIEANAKLRDGKVQGVRALVRQERNIQKRVLLWLVSLRHGLLCPRAYKLCAKAHDTTDAPLGLRWSIALAISSSCPQFIASIDIVVNCSSHHTPFGGHNPQLLFPLLIFKPPSPPASSLFSLLHPPSHALFRTLFVPTLFQH